MLSTKRLFVKITLVLCMFLLYPAQAKEREYRVGDTGRMLGFSKVENELAINPCLDEGLIRAKYADQGVQYARENLKKYPPNLCTNKQTLSLLSNWHYNASALVANSERPFILGREIAKNYVLLKECTTVDCLGKRLPRMLEWSKTTLSRTPITSRDVQPLFMGGAPIGHPQLALRGLQLPLSQQKEICGSEDLSSLKFATSTLLVSGRALAVVTCHDKKRLGTWLLERSENKGQWKEILVLPGFEDVAVLPNNRELYPHIFYKQKQGSTEIMTILRYSEAFGYQKRIQFELDFDAYGLAHAFNIQVF
ncbi:hypothetical protein [Pelistega suis]|uniref:Uncharacterized protein n=1 Tax=Pelistega suis TaxID=1631957 RepID=A0A849P2E9_9BURK|nr:hypothetical protein [Pelistega suis]NOL51849.1 hypothetical protein [Pelistega suis]